MSKKIWNLYRLPESYKGMSDSQKIEVIHNAGESFKEKTGRTPTSVYWGPTASLRIRGLRKSRSGPTIFKGEIAIS
jgi:hypothetical protein